MKQMWDDTVGLVIKKAGNNKQDGWKNVCVTEYRKTGEWMSGMNLVTSIDDVLEHAEKNKLNIIPEVLLQEILLHK